MDNKEKEKVITTENIFEGLTLSSEQDFSKLAKLIGDNITESNRPKKYTYAYVKYIIELLSPSIESSKQNDLIKFLTLATNEKKKEEAERKLKGIQDDADKPVQQVVNTRRNMDDDFF